MPDEKALEKISRYEAHLSRQLYAALHELEALQTDHCTPPRYAGSGGLGLGLGATSLLGSVDQDGDVPLIKVR